MIFRTGSVLIVGKCSDKILNNIYLYLKELLNNEYKNIGGELITKDITNKKKIKKVRRKIIINTNN